MKWVIGVSIVAVMAGAAATMTIPAQTVTPDQAILKLFPAETQGIALIDMAALRNAPLAQDLLAARGIPNFRGLGDFTEATGFVVERDLDRLTIGRIGIRNVLVVAEARYDRFKVEQFFMDKGIQPDTYMGRTIYPHRPMAVSFLDNLIIAGHADNVKKAIEQASIPGNVLLNSDLLNAIGSIEAGNQVWAVGAFSFDQLPVASSPGPVLDLVKTLRGGTYQMRLDQDAHARAIGNLADADSAKSLAELARAMVALVKLRVASNPDLLHALDGLQIQSSGSSVVVNVEEPGDLVMKLREFRPTIERIR